MTRDEAKNNYKKYRQGYETAECNRKKALYLADQSVMEKKRAEAELTSSKTSKKNLENRLEDIKHIISVFDGMITSSINNANRSAKNAEEKYKAAIKCTSVSSASIEVAFRTRSISEDADSSFAYRGCNTEKVRLEKAIEEIRIRINKLDSDINLFQNDIKKYTNNANTYAEQMQYFRTHANSCIPFM